MRKNLFDEIEFPYDTLAKYGLTQDMIDDLPADVMEALKQGWISPVLPLTAVDMETGEAVKLQFRLKFERGPSGQVDVVFFPTWEQGSMDNLSKDEQERLLAGETIVTQMSVGDGGSGVQAYAQYDRKTQHVLWAPVSVLEKNLSDVANRYELDSGATRTLLDGRPVKFMREGQVMVAGVDMNSKTGVRICLGDEQTWKEGEGLEREAHCFGLNGCWITDEEGNMDYVPESEYTKELWDEIDHKAQARISSMRR